MSSMTRPRRPLITARERDAIVEAFKAGPDLDRVASLFPSRPRSTLIALRAIASREIKQGVQQ